MDKIKAIILGHAVGDALGVPVEFHDRSYLKSNPVTKMIGYGTYSMPEGTWSDDTSMTIATLDSLADGVDYNDIMNKFCAWSENAEYTATNEFFDIGITTRNALSNYLNGKESLKCGLDGDYDNGNGSLMRIIPAALYCEYRMTNASLDQKISLIHNISSLTHAHKRSLVGCGIYAFVIWELVKEQDFSSVRRGLENAKKYYLSKAEYKDEFQRYSAIFNERFVELSEKDIKSSGYVVYSLEAAIWCVLSTSSYQECVLKAVNLGEDTDTIAAIAGGLAGILYGVDSIPQDWLKTLKKKDCIENICENAYKNWRKNEKTNN